MASGDSLYSWPANAGTPTVTNGATPDTRNSTVPHILADFDASTNESLLLPGVCSQAYSGSPTGVTIDVHIAMSSATTGDVDIDISMQSDPNLDSTTFGTVISSDNNTVPGTNGDILVITVVLADGAETNSLAAGDYFRLKLTRDAIAVSDTAAGDMELVFVNMWET